MVLVADKHKITPRSFGMRRDLGDALKDCALEIQLEHHAQNAGEPRVHRHRKVECEDVARFEKRVEPRERLWFARFGLGRI